MKRLVINANPNNLVIDFDEVICITAFNKKCLIVKSDGEEKRLNISLKVLYEKVESIGFIRCHKSFVVNSDYIESFNKSNCILKNGKMLPLGRKYFKEFKRIMYNKWFMEKLNHVERRKNNEYDS